jgi:2-polyprenyl-6-hydroxyphenyl methylase/3-demethylubiquinone-9 3-methyltransferase
MGAVASFIRWNQSLSHALEAKLPQARVKPREVYAQKVADVMNAQPGPVLVADVGGGKRCPFASMRDPEKDIRIAGVDVSEAELAANDDVDEKRVADITRELPFEDAEADLVVSSSVLEHLADTEAFVAESFRVLKPGGYAIHLFPSKFAPFAIANQILPARVSKRLLRSVFPYSEGILGFPAHYDRCSASAMRALHERHGFEITELHVGYYQSDYFGFLVPAYVLSAAYELILYTLNVNSLAANVLMVASKP